jgi:hypothetical protein
LIEDLPNVARIGDNRADGVVATTQDRIAAL